MYTNGAKKEVTKKKKSWDGMGFISTQSVAAMDNNVLSSVMHFILILPETILDSNSASLNEISNLNCIEVFR
jgi:hypothetical protein